MTTSQPGAGPEALAQVIDRLHKADHRFHVEGGSWTSDISWVRGYENVLGPMESASSLFSQKVIERHVPTSDLRYRHALFHLLASQTSCFRYWGEGVRGITAANFATTPPQFSIMISKPASPMNESG